MQFIGAEYGAGGEVSTKGDVYSFGILVLEMFTEKRPIDEMFSNGLNLHSFAKAGFRDRILQIVDPVLLEMENCQDNRGAPMSQENRLKIQECLASIMEIGIVCSSEAPRDRMMMNEVSAALQKIREKLLHICETEDGGNEKSMVSFSESSAEELQG